MKNILFFLLALILPIMLFLEVWIVFHYNKMDDEIEKLEQTQNEWFEKNKKLIAAIALYSSPERIDKIVRENLFLKKIDSHRIFKVFLGGQ